MPFVIHIAQRAGIHIDTIGICRYTATGLGVVVLKSPSRAAAEPNPLKASCSIAIRGAADASSICKCR